MGIEKIYEKFGLTSESGKASICRDEKRNIIYIYDYLETGEVVFNKSYKNQKTISELKKHFNKNQIKTNLDE